MRRQGGFAVVPFLILTLVIALGAADTIHSSTHGSIQLGREYQDPHKSEPPLEVAP